MSKNQDRLPDVFQREPDRSGFLLKMSGLGIVMITAWQVLAGLFLGPFVAVPISLILLALYAASLVFQTARLVHESDRWQKETKQTAEALTAGDRRRPEHLRLIASNDGVPVRSLVATNSFHRAHFLLNVQEEILRARREGQAVALLALDVSYPGREGSAAEMDALSAQMAELANRQARVIRLAYSPAATRFSFLLKDGDVRSVRAFTSEVVQALGDYWCVYGLATYPEDATEALPLYEAAFDKLEAVRGAGTSSRPRGLDNPLRHLAS